MNFIRCIAIVLPLAVLALGCERKAATRIVDPPPAASVQIEDAQWVLDRGALESAVQLAAVSPLVKRAIANVRDVRLTPLYSRAVSAVGTATDGSRVSATILPHIVGDDSTHATFVSLLSRDGRQLAEVSELILGRVPSPLETGFHPVTVGNRIGWLKGGDTYLLGADGLPHLSAERRYWIKFMECVLSGAPGACRAGAEIADGIAPGVPRAEAIGCGLGVAALAVGCALEHLR
jgi:hypothetical protein